MHYYLGFARKEKLTEEEIGAVQSIVMAVSAGRIQAQFRDVYSKFKSFDKTDEDDCTCGK